MEVNGPGGDALQAGLSPMDVEAEEAPAAESKQQRMNRLRREKAQRKRDSATPSEVAAAKAMTTAKQKARRANSRQGMDGEALAAAQAERAAGKKAWRAESRQGMDGEALAAAQAKRAAWQKAWRAAVAETAQGRRRAASQLAKETGDLAEEKARLATVRRGPGREDFEQDVGLARDVFYRSSGHTRFADPRTLLSEVMAEVVTAEKKASYVAR